jgi:hypothetical protein
MKLSDLDNREILFIYFSNRKWLDTYEDIFEHKSLEDVMNILDFGQIRITQPLNDEEIIKIQESEHYIIASNINNKLEDIVDMIEEADKSLYDEVRDCFDKAKI